MADFVEVVDAGPGWTTVRDSEGNVFTLEGARNWRNNNPGNIEFGPFAQSAGAVGTDGRFAVFPSYEQGRAAKEQLIFSSPNYRDLTLAQAISRYAPPSENNTQAYLNAVTRAAGISKDTTMGQIDPATRSAILDAMQKVEGFQVGRTRNAQGNPVPPLDIPNVVASELSVTRPTSAYRNPTPATQSNPIAAQRSLIPSDASPALKAALARLASQSVQAVPVTQSPDLALNRNPAMSIDAQTRQVTPYPRTASPGITAVRNIGSPQGNPYQGIFGGTRLPPVANPGQDNVGSYPSYSQLRGLFSAPTPNNAPVPAMPSLVTRTMRALGPSPAPLQQALNASLQPRVAPVPMPASARPREPGLKIVVDGANPIAAALAPQRPNAITPIQTLMGQGLTSAQAYNALTAAAQGAPSLEDRITGRSSSSGGGASSISSW